MRATVASACISAVPFGIQDGWVGRLETSLLHHRFNLNWLRLILYLVCFVEVIGHLGCFVAVTAGRKNYNAAGFMRPVSACTSV